MLLHLLPAAFTSPMGNWRKEQSTWTVALTAVLCSHCCSECAIKSGRSCGTRIWFRWNFGETLRHWLVLLLENSKDIQLRIFYVFMKLQFSWEISMKRPVNAYLVSFEDGKKSRGSAWSCLVWFHRECTVMPSRASVCTSFRGKITSSLKKKIQKSVCRRVFKEWGKLRRRGVKQKAAYLEANLLSEWKELFFIRILFGQSVTWDTLEENVIAFTKLLMKWQALSRNSLMNTLKGVEKNMVHLRRVPGGLDKYAIVSQRELG